MILIEGGKGAGKSVIGLNLMNYLLGEEATNESFRKIFRKKLIGQIGLVEVRSFFKGLTEVRCNTKLLLLCFDLRRSSSSENPRPYEKENQ